MIALTPGLETNMTISGGAPPEASEIPLTFERRGSAYRTCILEREHPALVQAALIGAVENYSLKLTEPAKSRSRVRTSNAAMVRARGSLKKDPRWQMP